MATGTLPCPCIPVETISVTRTDSSAGQFSIHSISVKKAGNTVTVSIVNLVPNNSISSWLSSYTGLPAPVDTWYTNLFPSSSSSSTINNLQVRIQNNTLSIRYGENTTFLGSFTYFAA